MKAAAYCQRKRAFETKAEANDAMREMFRRGVGNNRKHVYRCIWCDKWHIGKKQR